MTGRVAVLKAYGGEFLRRTVGMPRGDEGLRISRAGLSMTD